MAVFVAKMRTDAVVLKLLATAICASIFLGQVSSEDTAFKRSKKTLNLFKPMPDNTTGCVLKCPEGSTKKSREGYQAQPAKCTSIGMDLKLELFEATYPGLRDCCFEHDVCYGTCSKTKKECDDVLSDCMDLYCHSMDTERHRKSCNVASNLLDTSVEKLGCESYLKLQEEACDCHAEKHEEL